MIRAVESNKQLNEVLVDFWYNHFNVFAGNPDLINTSIDDYLAVLSAGGSRYAYELLQEYGIDLATDGPYDALIARMDRVMDEIEAIMDRQGN